MCSAVRGLDQILSGLAALEWKNPFRSSCGSYRELMVLI